MAGREDGAAVLIGQAGGLHGADFLGNVDDLALVEADQRAENGHVHHHIRGAQGRHGLGRHLADGFAGDQRLRLLDVRHALGNAHHVAAHDQRRVLLRALLVDLHLNLGEGHDVHADAAAALRQDAGQVKHLFLRAVGGVGIGVEVHGADVHAALGDHPASHRAVDAAGKEQRRAAVGAHGHAAHSGPHLAVQVRMVADLHVQHMIGLLHVHREGLVRDQDAVADLGVDGGAVQRVTLVGAAAGHLEGAGKALHHLHRLGGDGFEVRLVHLNRRADAVHAKDLRHLADGFVHFRHVGDKDAAVVHGDVAAQLLHGILDALDQRADKGMAVEALEENLAITDEQQFTHGWFSLSSDECFEHVVVLLHGGNGVVDFLFGDEGAEAEAQRTVRLHGGQAHARQHAGHLLLVSRAGRSR